jgi:hypothetical protein
VTDPSQTPEPSDEAQISDVPAALEPDAPTVSHPVPQQPAADAAPLSPVPAVPEPTPVPAAERLSPTSPEPAWAPPAPDLQTSGAADRPELAIGAAFAGGLVLALILKRFAR